MSSDTNLVRKSTRARLATLLLGVSLTALASSPAFAANGTDTWNGNTSTNWGTAGNWTGANTPPISGDSLVIAQTGTNEPSNNTLTLTNISSLALHASSDGTTITNGYLLAGNSIGFASGATISDSAGNTGTDQINTALALSGSTSIIVSSGSSLTINGNITGTGPLTLTNNNATLGTLTLGGTNTYSGGTSITAGAVTVGSSSNLSGSISLANGTTLDVTATSAFSNLLTLNGISTVNTASGQTTTWNGLIQGSGTLNVTGAGTFVLTPPNTYTGGTIVQGGGTVSAGNDTDFGGASGGLQLGGTGKGTLDATATFTLGAGRTVTIGNGNGEIDVSSSQTFSIIQGISGGSGSLTVGGTGTLVLAGASGYAGGTTIKSGATLQLGDGTNAGSIENNVVDNGAIVFNEGGDAAFDGVISGSGTLTQNDTTGGTLSLTKANSYTGNTNITSGTLQLGDGGSTGSISILSQVNVGSGTTLAFDHSGNFTFGSTIVSTTTGGTIAQNGGTTTLTGNNTGFTGDVDINAGTLKVAAQSNLGDGTGTIAIQNGATLAITGSDTFTNNVTLDGQTYINTASGQTASFSGVISDQSAPSALNVTGPGTLVLTNTETYSGGTTIGPNGTLQLGDGASAGIIVGNPTVGVVLSPGGTLVFVEPSQTTYAGNIVGSGGSLHQEGTTGKVILTGTVSLNSAPAQVGVTVDSGTTLQIGNGGSAGSLHGNADVSGTLSFDLSGAAFYTDSLTGSGALTQDGGNTLFLSGDNTGFTGEIDVNSHTLSVIEQKNLGGATVKLATGTTLAITGTAPPPSFSNELDITGNGTVNVTPVGVATWTGLIADGASAGTLNVTGGTLVLTDTSNSYTGGTVVKGGATLSIDDDSELGTGGLTLGDASTPGTLSVTGTTSSSRAVALGAIGGEIDVASSDVYTVSSGITGAGAGSTLKVGGTGTLLLTGANTYSGATTIVSGATLQLGDGGSLSSNVTDNGTFSFNQTGTNTFSLDISGTGSVSQDGSGTTILTGNNSYNGGTAVNAGVLQVGDGTTVGSIVGAVSIASGAELSFAHSDNIGFSGDISGSGLLAQNGSGTLTLGGNNSTFSGEIDINSGALSVAGQSALGDGTGKIVMAAGTQLNLIGTSTFLDEVDLNGDPTFNVTSGVTATWNGLITDGASPPGTLEVIGGGKLILGNASNSYTGGTIVKGASTVSVAADGDLGTGGVTLGDGTATGTLETTASFTSLTRAITLGTKGGTIQTDAGVTTEFDTAIDGTGKLTKTGTGTLVLGADATYSGGGTTISAGTLQLGNGGSAGNVGTGNVTDNGNLAFDRNDTLTFANLITGNGSLTQMGTGTTILTAADTYGGNTSITAGTLQLGDGVTNGSITGNVSDAGTLAFDDTGSFSFAGVISDGASAGAVQQLSTGTTILTGNNTYTGGTSIKAGTLQLGGGGVSGSIVGDVTNAGTLAFNRSDTYTFGGVISDGLSAGAVSQIGVGTTILTGTNTYTGATSVAAGTLQLGNNGATGSIGNTSGVSLASGATLAFDRNNAVTFDKVISGTGGKVTQIGSGTTTLTATNTYTGTTTVSAGTLQIGSGGIVGSIGNTSGVSIASGATLAFNRSDTVTFGAGITGGGKVTQSGGTLILTANSSYSGGTTINTGATLQLGNGGTSGAISGNVSDAGTLTFDRTDGLTFSGVISDGANAGALVQEGSGGLLILTGNSTYTGGTTIAASSTLQLGNGGSTGSIAHSATDTITDNGTLNFDRSDGYTYAGVISGTGGVTQSGSGITTLTGTNTYHGATNVLLGSLIVNGSIANSATNVAGGAMLGGTGTVGALTVAGGGTVAPGNGAIGTLTVQGSLTLMGGSHTVIASTAAATDLLQVNGAAALGGSLQVTASGTGYVAGQQLTVLTATGGLSGDFNTFSAIGFDITFAPTESKIGNSVVVTLGPSTVSSLLTSAGSTNLNSIVDAINFAIAHDGAAAAFAGLGSLSSDQVETVLYQMDGEVAPSVKTVVQHSTSSFLGTMLDPNVAGRDGLADGAGVTLASLKGSWRVAYDGPDDEVPVEHAPHRLMSVWGDIRGDHADYGANPILGTHDTSATDFGADIGFNYSPYSGRGAVGAAFGYDTTNWDLAPVMGKGHASVYQLGAYYSRMFGPNYVSAAASFGDYNVKTDRVVNFGGTNVYEAKFTARSVAGRFEYGHIFDVSPSSQLIPYLHYEAQDLHTPTYNEKTIQGSSLFALGYTQQEHFDYTTELGLGWNAVLDSSNDSLTKLRTRLGWEHDYNASVKDTATFSAFNGASFTVLGSPPAQNSAHLALGIDHEVDGWSLGLSADSLLAGRSQSYSGNANVAVHW